MHVLMCNDSRLAIMDVRRFRESQFPFSRSLKNAFETDAGLQACRMAVELGMHRVGGGAVADPTEPMSAAERRNRERTYLVLFIQDRTLAMLSGKQTMLPDVSPLTRNCFRRSGALASSQTVHLPGANFRDYSE